MSAPVVNLNFLRAGNRGASVNYGGAMPDMHMASVDDLRVTPNAPEALSAGFLLPPVADPAAYSREHFQVKYTEDNEQALQFAKGTTTLAFIYDGGIIVAVDSRSTMGPFIASQQVKKVNPINEYILATLAGGAADCQFWQRNLAVQCRMYELRNGMSLGMMMMGYDNGKPVLYYVDDEGSRIPASKTVPKFSVGSGSTFAYGVMDTNWRWDLTDDEAVELGKRAIYHATHRDAYSGGFCNVFLFKPDGFKQVVHEDVKEMHDYSRDN
jgi:20S proteasome subunit beta 5